MPPLDPFDRVTDRMLTQQPQSHSHEPLPRSAAPQIPRIGLRRRRHPCRPAQQACRRHCLRIPEVVAPPRVLPNATAANNCSQPINSKPNSTSSSSSTRRRPTTRVGSNRREASSNRVGTDALITMRFPHPATPAATRLVVVAPNRNNTICFNSISHFSGHYTELVPRQVRKRCLRRTRQLFLLGQYLRT